MGQLNQRRGTIISSEKQEGFVQAMAEVPLNDMFGYSTDLRSATQGKGEFTMEFQKYAEVPKQAREVMMAEFRAKKEKEQVAGESRLTSPPPRRRFASGEGGLRTATGVWVGFRAGWVLLVGGLQVEARDVGLVEEADDLPVGVGHLDLAQLVVQHRLGGGAQVGVGADAERRAPRSGRR